MIEWGEKQMTNENIEENKNEQNPNEETAGSGEQMSQAQLAELVKAVHHNGLVALRMHFKNVEGQVLNMSAFGPVFVYHVTDESNHRYSCGYFLREMVNKFQKNQSPDVWMASFFVDLMKNKGGKEFPKPPADEEEAKAVIDKVLVPSLVQSIEEEFAPEPVHAGLALNPQYGPVFEAGFPQIKDGSNVCAVPLHLLLTHLQLNRDPSEILIQGMYNIRKEHGLE